MGNIKSLEYLYSKKPELLPESDSKPTFKTDYGFDKPRQKRGTNILTQNFCYKRKFLFLLELQ